jgi:hypothetical protein
MRAGTSRTLRGADEARSRLRESICVPCTIPAYWHQLAVRTNTQTQARTVEERPHEQERHHVLLPGVHELEHPAGDVRARPPLDVEDERAGRARERRAREEARARPALEAEHARARACEARRDELGVRERGVMRDVRRVEPLLLALGRCGHRVWGGGVHRHTASAALSTTMNTD